MLPSVVLRVKCDYHTEIRQQICDPYKDNAHATHLKKTFYEFDNCTIRKTLIAFNIVRIQSDLRNRLHNRFWLW